MGKLIHVVAVDKNHCIGRDGSLAWHVPADLKYFKHITLGKTVAMGRKTFDSIGKPLPNRKNIILTKQNIEIDGAITASNIQSLLGDEDIYIIGGSQIYAETIDIADMLIVSHIDIEVNSGDAFYPEIPERFKKKTSRKVRCLSSEISFEISIYEVA